MGNTVKFGSHVRIRFGIGSKESIPFRLPIRTPLYRLTIMSQCLIRNQEKGFHWPAQSLFRQTQFRFTQRFAVSRHCILFVRAAIADVGMDSDERRPFPFITGGGNRFFGCLFQLE